MPLGFHDDTIHRWRTQLAEGHSVIWLKTAIVLWALFIIVLVVFIVDNPWLLAGILLYEILP